MIFLEFPLYNLQVLHSVLITNHNVYHLSLWAIYTIYHSYIITILDKLIIINHLFPWAMVSTALPNSQIVFQWSVIHPLLFVLFFINHSYSALSDHYWPLSIILHYSSMIVCSCSIIRHVSPNNRIHSIHHDYSLVISHYSPLSILVFNH